MARTTKPLTNTEVKQAKPREKEFNLVDGNGLRLRVKPNGSKLWLFNYYRPHTGKRANLSLGTYPEVSLADARNATMQARKLVAQDIDPAEHRRELAIAERDAHLNTLRHVAESWFEVKRSQVTADYAQDIWRSLELHIFPSLGKLPIHKVKATSTIESLKPVAAKGSLETVKRLCQRLNEVMTFAVNTGLIDANPLARIGQAFLSPPKRHMPALKPERLPELMQTLSRAKIKNVTRCLIEWQLHTMLRPKEAAMTRWDEIDWEQRLLRIPAERMKKKRPHSLPLTNQTLALLQFMQPLSGDQVYVFPSDRKRNQHIHPSTANVALKRMGFKGETVAHGLRSLASTTLNEEGFDPDVVEAALAHIDSNEVRAAYNRSDYLNRRKAMMEWWSQHIEAAARGDLSVAASHRGLTVLRSAS